jgi:hypothetical protein
VPANDNDLLVVRRLDELFTAWPFLGSRRMARMLTLPADRQLGVIAIDELTPVRGAHRPDLLAKKML